MPIVLGLAAATVAYALAWSAAARAGRAVPGQWRVASYLAGMATLGLALAGPVEEQALGGLAGHMLQHMLLLLVAPPLIVLGRPTRVLLRGLPSPARRALLRRTLGRAGVRRALGLLIHPLVLTPLVNGTLLIWHLPGPYAAAVREPLVHGLEHLCFLGGAMVLWWALTGPELPRVRRWSTPTALLVLFATWMIGDLLGATLTLAPTSLYAVYQQSGEEAAALADQRLAGLIMWVGGGVYYAALMVGLLAAPRLMPDAARSAARGKGVRGRRPLGLQAAGLEQPA